MIAKIRQKPKNKGGPFKPWCYIIHCKGLQPTPFSQRPAKMALASRAVSQLKLTNNLKEHS